jgi:hypothetical protein
LGDLGVDGRAILESVLEKYGVTVWAAFPKREFHYQVNDCQVLKEEPVPLIYF